MLAFGVIVDDRYERGELLGEGAFGRTYLATNRESGEQVVIKELTVQGLPDWKPIEHFEREARVLGSLDHPGVPRFIEALQHEGDGQVDLYIVTEHVPGRTLQQEIADGARWDEARALELMNALLDTLNYLHRLSPPVVHRDIKPGNIVLRPSGAPVLIDFGAVRDLASRQPDGALTVLGTPGYMAPEQALGQADARSDIYALGTTLVHAFTHQAPLDLPRTGMRIEFAHLMGLSPTLVDVLQRMTEPNPADRFDRVSEVIDALRAPDESEKALALASASTRALAKPTTTTTTVALPASPRPLHRSVARRLKSSAILSRMPVGHQLGLLLTPVGLVLAAMIAVAASGGASWLMLTMLGLSTVIGGGGVMQYLRSRSRSQQRVYQEGTQCEGRIISVKSFGPGAAHIHYEYQVAGTWHESALTSQEAAATDSLRPGDALAIVYDESQPSRHVALLHTELATMTDDE